MADHPLDILTFSSGSMLAACEKKFFWRHERQIVPRKRDDDDDDSLFIGNLFHHGVEHFLSGGLDAGLAAINEWEAAQSGLGDEATRIMQRAAKTRAMVRVAWLRWKHPPGVAEEIVSCDIVNPETGRKSRSFRFMGKRDGKGDRRVYDYKSACDPSRKLREVQLSPQAELYSLDDTSGVDCLEIRIVANPAIKMCSTDAPKHIEIGPRGGKKEVPHGPPCPLRYEDRCVNWLCDPKHPHRIISHELNITPSRIEAARHWLWTRSKAILDNRNTGRWMKNVANCYHYERECPYMLLCLSEVDGSDTEWLIGEHYEHADPHPELEGSVIET